MVDDDVDDAMGAVIEFISDDNCGLFSEAGEDLDVEEDDLLNLLQAGGGKDNVLASLAAFDAAGRKFMSLPEITAEVSAAGDADDAIGAVIEFISDDNCGLFSEAGDDLDVEEDDLLNLVEAGGGKDSVLAKLAAFDAAGKKFMSITEITAELSV